MTILVYMSTLSVFCWNVYSCWWDFKVHEITGYNIESEKVDTSRLFGSNFLKLIIKKSLIQDG
jgi:hypothetical protein